MKRRVPSTSRIRLAGLAALMAGALFVPSTGAAAPRTRGSHPNAAAGHSTRLGSDALEVNGATWDSGFLDTAIPGLLRQAGVKLVRWPGGSTADGYNWETNSGGGVDFSQFMNQIAKAGAAPFITVNYGDASLGPAVAAAWVKKALTFPGYSDSTARWEVGNENYGPWENDTHPAPHTPQSYADNALAYFQAMHAADPSAQVGFPYALTRSQSAGTGTWVADPAAWNDTVLGRDGSQIDFADVHWYPIFGNPSLTPAQIMATVRRIPAVMASVRSTLAREDPGAYVIAGESNISQTGIVSNEQPIAALYAAATGLEFLSEGARSYGWWDIHNTPNLDQDFGFLSSGGQAAGPYTTTLSVPALRGQRNLQVAATSGFEVGHTITVGTGASAQYRQVTAVGGGTTLAVAAGAGARNLKLATVTPFAPGAPVTIGSGNQAESDSVAKVGTGAGQATLAAPVAHGSQDVKVVGVAQGGQATPVFMPSGFAPGARITVGAGPTAETRTIRQVGTSSSLATTTVAPAAAGATTLHVASVADTSTGVAFYVGDEVTVGSGAHPETDTIASVGTSGATGTGITLTRPLSAAEPTGVDVRDAGTGITLSRPLQDAYGAGGPVSTPGTGITLTRPLTAAQPAGAPAASSGVTVTPALQRDQPAGTAVLDPGTQEPPKDTPMPAYYGYQLASLLTAPGARLTALATPRRSLFAFASSLRGRQALMLINSDDAHSAVVALNGVSAHRPGTISTYRYSLEHPTIVRRTESSAGRLMLGPESIEVVVAQSSAPLGLS